MPDEPPTFQDLVKRQQRASLVGRADEQALFTENLERDVDDLGRLLIFNLHGQGGMGKTFLARRLSEVAKDRGRHVTWTDETATDPVDVMRTIAEDLTSRHLKPFLDREKGYRQKRHELESDPDAPSSLVELVARGVGQGAVRLGRHIPGAGLAFEILDEDLAGDQLALATAFLAKKLASSEDFYLIQDPLAALTPLFLEGLTSASRRLPLALFFDTFELTGSMIEPWLLDTLAGRYGPVTSNMVIVIGGRQPLDPNLWAEFAGVIAHFEMEPFGLEETREYLRRRGITDTDLVSTIFTLSAGMPLLLAMLAASPPDNPEDTDDAADTAVERFLKWIPDSARRELALRCSIPRVFNQDILARLPPSGTQGPDSYRWLCEMPFTNRIRFGWHYHDVVRQQMLAVVRTQSPDAWRLTHAELAEYHLDSMDALMRTRSSDEPVTLHHEREMFYHYVVIAPDRKIDLVNRICERYFSDNDSAHQLAGTLVDAERDSDTQDKLLGIRLASVLRRADSGHPEELIDLLATLLDGRSGDIEPGATNGIHLALARFCERDNAWRRALPHYTMVLENEPTDFRARVGRTFARIELAEVREATDDLTSLLDETDMPDAFRAILYPIRARLFATRDRSAAIRDLDLAIGLSDDEGPLRAQKATILLESNDVSGALHEARLAVEASPESHSAVEALAIATEHSGEIGESIRISQRALEADATCTSCWRLYLQQLTASSTVEDALEQMRAVKLSTDQEHVARAYGLMSIGAFDAARLDIQSALALNERSASVWAALGSLETRREAFDEAIRAFVRANELDPEDALVLYRRSVAHMERGDLDAAGKDASATIAREAGNAEAYLHRAKIRHKQGDSHGALADLDRAVELDSDYLLSRAQFHIEADRLEAALDDQIAARAWDESEHTTNAIGLTLSYLGRYSEAITEFESCSRESPPELAVQYNLAVAAVRRDGVDASKSHINALEEAISREQGSTSDGAILYAEAGLAALLGKEQSAIELLAKATAEDGTAREWARRDPAWSGLLSLSPIAEILQDP